jgi:hypothetical protein
MQKQEIRSFAPHNNTATEHFKVGRPWQDKQRNNSRRALSERNSIDSNSERSANDDGDEEEMQ